MKTSTLSILFLFIAGTLLSGFLFSTRNVEGKGKGWEEVSVTQRPHKRHENAFVEAGKKFHLIGGRKTLQMDIFDPKTRTWSRGTDLPMEMHHFQALTYKGEIYVMGAFTGGYPGETPIPDIHIYNPLTQKWRTEGMIPEDRRRGAAGVVSYQDKIYVVAGIQNGHIDGHVKWFDEYDPQTHTWKKLPDAPHARDHFHAVVVGDKLYVAGGRRSSQATKQTFQLTTPEVDIFDFKTGTWTTLPQSANLPTERAGTMAVAYKGKVVIMGGESGSQEEGHREVEVLDPKSNIWTRLALMEQGRHGTQAIVYKNKVYIAAGSGNRGGGPELDRIDHAKLSWKK